MKKLYGLIFLMLILFSCEKEEDCVGCDLNPKIKLKFQAVGTKQVTDSIFSDIKETISVLVDSLEGQLTNELRAKIQSELEQLREDSLKFDEDYNLFRLNKAKFDVVEAPGSVDFEQFQDSIISDFSIPVDMNRDTSIYYFHYHSLVDTLQLYYQREIIQNFDGVRMRIKDIKVDEDLSTFDSVRVNCYNRECSNDLTYVYVYF